MSGTTRLLREIAEMQKGTDLSLHVAFRDENVRHIRALIIGPPETPYAFGFFEFNLRFPSSYPTTSPSVRAITTDCGRARFNPNIYSNGKVCLSILGTWAGEAGEQWSTAQGVESVLISIQSLLNANPYENEPGFEADSEDNRSIDEWEARAYAAKIRHETLRVTVVKRLELMFGVQSLSEHDLERAKLLRNPARVPSDPVRRSIHRPDQPRA